MRQLIYLTFLFTKHFSFAQTPTDIMHIPFRLAGNLITVDVQIDGQTRQFIVDSGSPSLILNSKYLNKSEEEGEVIASQGVNGEISGMYAYRLNSFKWQDIELQEADVIALDLNHLEQELGTEIYGLIGADILQKYDVLFDYKAKELVLIPPAQFAAYRAEHFPKADIAIQALETDTHIPVLKATIAGQEFAFGLDCGAETNLISSDRFAGLKPHLKNLAEDELVGADNHPVIVRTATTKQMEVGDKVFKNMRTLFTDISHLNEGYGLKIDGLLGYEVFSRQKTVLSFTRKELLFID